MKRMTTKMVLVVEEGNNEIDCHNLYRNNFKF